MDKTNIKIVIKSINELKEHLDSKEVQECIQILKSIAESIDKNKTVLNYVLEGGKFDINEDGEHQLVISKDDTTIFIDFTIESHTIGKYNEDPTLNTEEIEYDIIIDSVMFSIPSDDQIDIPLNKEVQQYITKIINYNNKEKMRKLTDIIKESESNKPFNYQATVIVEGRVYADSEGSAGELVDKEMDEFPGMVSYELINISEEMPTEGFTYKHSDLATNEGSGDRSFKCNVSFDLFSTIANKEDVESYIKESLEHHKDFNNMKIEVIEISSNIEETKIATNKGLDSNIISKISTVVNKLAIDQIKYLKDEGEDFSSIMFDDVNISIDEFEKYRSLINAILKEYDLFVSEFDEDTFNLEFIK